MQFPDIMDNGYYSCTQSRKIETIHQAIELMFEDTTQFILLLYVSSTYAYINEWQYSSSYFAHSASVFSGGEKCPSTWSEW